MTQYELLATVAAQLMAAGRSVEGSIADARELLERLQSAEPATYLAHLRSRTADAHLRIRTIKALEQRGQS